MNPLESLMPSLPEPTPKQAELLAALNDDSRGHEFTGDPTLDAQFTIFMAQYGKPRTAKNDGASHG